MKKKIIFFLLLISIFCLCTACGKKKQTKNENIQESGKDMESIELPEDDFTSDDPVVEDDKTNASDVKNSPEDKNSYDGAEDGDSKNNSTDDNTSVREPIVLPEVIIP